MKRVTLLVMVVAGVLVGGCMGTPIPITGSMGGLVYTDINSGFQVPPASVRAMKEKYTVIQENVQGNSDSLNVLMVVGSGDSSFRTAFNDALSKAPGATDIIDITVDLQKYNILCCFTRTTLHIYGTAIKYEKDDKK